MTEPDAIDRAELLDLYKLAVDEYRFQVQLNWDRAKYLIGFNSAIVGVGTGLLRLNGDKAEALILGVFMIGFVSSALSMIAASLQHTYYQSTRDSMVALADELGILERSIRTTPGARSARTTRLSKLGRVQTILQLILMVTALVDLFGAAYALGWF